jgi:hypothetical protein
MYEPYSFSTPKSGEIGTYAKKRGVFLFCFVFSSLHEKNITVFGFIH